MLRVQCLKSTNVLGGVCERTKQKLLLLNKMFGRNWNYHNEEAEIDVDTLPDKKNARRVGKCIEAMALSEIVMELYPLMTNLQ
eukprot:Em0002g568a